MSSPDPYVELRPNPYGGPPAYGQPAYGQHARGGIIDGLLTAHVGPAVGSATGSSSPARRRAGRHHDLSLLGRRDRQDPDPCRPGRLLRVLHLQPRQPIRAGMSFVRQLAHVLDGLCYLGYLWPLRDSKRRTSTDKVLSTVGVNQPAGR